MMKLLLVAVVALVVPALGYDEVYDKIDVDKILADDALFSAYMDCMLDKGPCSMEHSADFRKLLPEVIATSCAKCSPIQRQNVRKSVKALSERKPAEFIQFRAKYDPKGEYEKDFAVFMTGTD